MRWLVVLLLWVRGAGATFAVVTDWGRGGLAQRQAVGAALRARNVSFVVSVGDNFFPRGILRPGEPAVMEWETAYAPRVPWYFALGTADHAGSTQAQLDLAQIFTHWNMPALYYDVERDGTHLFVLDTDPWVRADDPVQEAWLRARWGNSSAAHKIIVGHHPLWTCGPRDQRDWSDRHMHKVVTSLLEDSWYVSGRKGVSEQLPTSAYGVHSCLGYFDSERPHSVCVSRFLAVSGDLCGSNLLAMTNRTGFLLVDGDSLEFVPTHA